MPFNCQAEFIFTIIVFALVYFSTIELWLLLHVDQSTYAVVLIKYGTHIILP